MQQTVPCLLTSSIWGDPVPLPLEYLQIVVCPVRDNITDNKITKENIFSIIGKESQERKLSPESF